MYAATALRLPQFGTTLSFYVIHNVDNKKAGMRDAPRLSSLYMKGRVGCNSVAALYHEGNIFRLVIQLLLFLALRIASLSSSIFAVHTAELSG